MLHRRNAVLLRTIVTNELPFVQATRKYLGDLILACFQGQADAQTYAERLSTASAELLENAFKYSPPGTDLTVRLSKSPTELLLQVSNTLQEEGRQVLTSIRRQIGAVWAERDAKEAFRKRVLSSLTEPGAKAMLGYAKIRMETGGRLRARLRAHGRLDVTLSFPLSAGPQGQTVPFGP